jgi:hypothetical protein
MGQQKRFTKAFADEPVRLALTRWIGRGKDRQAAPPIRT